MKQLLIFISLLLVTTSLKAQFNDNAPWMKELQEKSTKKEHTLQEISDAFNSYWEIHKDKKDKKGSGYKPFKRWESRWEHSLNKKGTIISNTQLWESWQQKNALNQNNVTDISNWQSIGPLTQESKSGQGRVNVIAVDPNHPNTYYIGAPAGGIWRSTDSGSTWMPLSDHLPQIGVSGIAIDPTDSNTIYIATGDDDASQTYSVGVMKTTDGGVTWNHTGLHFTNSGQKSHEIYIHPSNSNILWVATSNGVYKTIDAGIHWNITLNGNIRDLKLKPGNPNIIYAVTSNRFYKSIDSGDNFIHIATGLPINSSRFAIDVTPANNNIIYLLSSNVTNGFQGVYKSTDSGSSFNQTLETTDVFGGSQQAWYDMSLTVSDTDEDIVFVGVLDLWKSTNGGDDFTQINQWYNEASPTFTHADIHFLRYYNGALFCGSDGGIYKSINDGISFNELNEGLAISQFYRIANGYQSTDNIVGGLQDNGGFAYSNNTWYKYHGGDGMDCAVNPNNPNIYYGFTQYGGSLNITQNGGVSGQWIASSPEQGNWITPLTMSSDGELYAGFSHLYKLINQQWQVVSGNVFGGRLDCLEIDPNNTSSIFVARQNRLYKSVDSGVNFLLAYTALNNISSIEINNDDSSTIYLSTGGTNGSILKSVDSGVNFINITNNLPSEPKLIIKHQPYSTINDLYVGTSLGVYHTNDTMTNWESYSNGLPNVPVRDLEININDQKIIAGTFGRSVWESPIDVIAPSDDVRLVSIVNPDSNWQCETNITPTITVKNNGQNIISQVQFDYTIDNNTSTNYTYNGTINSQEVIDISLPQINNLTLGEHQITVNTSIANDAYSENNTSTVPFYINQVGANPTTINPFDSYLTDSWLTVENQNVWTIGQPFTTLLGASGNTGYTTNLLFNYPDNTAAYLVSPCYDLTNITNPLMKFNMAFDIEIDWDVLYVEYSTDQNQSWHVLGTANDPNWYNSNYDQHQLTIGKQWTGTESTLKEYSHDLSFLTNESSIIFRFAFLTDQSINNEGVFINDFVIEGQVANTNDYQINNTIIVHPNPSTKGSFTISRQTDENLDISIYDISGKLIFKELGIQNATHHLNLNASKGVYFLRLQSDTSTIIKKIMIE